MSEHVEVHRGGELTIKSPEAVRVLSALISAGASVATRGDHIAPSPMVRHLLGASELAAARSSAAESSEDPQQGDQSGSSVDELIGTLEASEMLHTTDRTIRNWCHGGRLASAVQMGRTWSISRAEVEALTAGEAA